MKKTLAWLAVGILVVGLVLTIILRVTVTLREQTIAERKPLTLERLDQLAKRMERPQAVQTPQTEILGEADATVGIPLPERLERVPSPEDLARKFAKEGHERGIARDAVVFKAFEGVLGTFGFADNFTFQVGEILMSAGEWDDARRYLGQALEESTSRSVFRRVCARLAWLEEDPQKAVRLLELSIDEEALSSRIEDNRIAGKDRVADLLATTLEERLADAVELCRSTGSEVLAYHYLERLGRHNPEAARRVDGESREEWG